MRYAGFWKRFVAAWVDFFVLVPILVLNEWLMSGSKLGAIASYVLATFVAWLYPVYFHGRWGQTLGKMAVKVRVVHAATGEPIGPREAILRSSVDGALALLAMIGIVIAIPRIPDAQFAAANWYDRNSLIEAATPAALAWVVWAEAVWGWGELITLLCNRKRRALHDFIAGTVVVVVEKPQP